MCFWFESEKLHFACVSGHYLLYWSFPRLGRQTQRCFNVFSSSSRRENYIEKSFIQTILIFNKHIRFMSIKKVRRFFPIEITLNKYVETTSNLCPSNLHPTSTLKWQGNLSNFYFWRINVFQHRNNVNSTHCVPWRVYFCMPSFRIQSICKNDDNNLMLV